MPIRQENKARYPKDWKQTRARILTRANNRCEWPACGVANYSKHPLTGSKVVLTIAHLDHTPEHCDESNLRAWCQMHHLRYDQEHHMANAHATRRKRKAAGDLFA